MRVRRLHTAIKKNRYQYKLIERTPTKAIYAQEDYGYEVFKINLFKPHPKSLDDLERYDLVEYFPNNEDFGRKAWSVRSFDDAKKIYDAL